MDKTHIDMAGQAPNGAHNNLTWSFESHDAPPPKCHAHPWNTSIIALLHTSRLVQMLIPSLILQWNWQMMLYGMKNPLHPPAMGDLSWATLLLNETHMQLQVNTQRIRIFETAEQCSDSVLTKRSQLMS